MAIRDEYIDVTIGTNERYQRINEQYQYDRGMKLRIHGLSLNDVFSAQFGNTIYTSTINSLPRVESGLWVVDIPDLVLTQPDNVQCYLYFTKSVSGYTGYEISLPQIKRAEPSGYIYDPSGYIPNYNDLLAEITEMREASADARSAATSANTAATNANNKASAADTAASSANTAAGNAELAAIKINNMTVTAHTVEYGAGNSVTKSIVDGHYHLDFGNERGAPGRDGAVLQLDAVKISFEIIDGDLIMNYGDDTPPQFSINANGDLIYSF